jgi:hypothetical protein
VAADGGSELGERDWEVHVLHLPRKCLFHVLTQARGCVDVPLVAGRKQWQKEWQALDVVPMRMAYQDMAAQRPFVGSQESESEAVAPVPQSRTTRVPSAVRTATHEVLPP